VIAGDADEVPAREVPAAVLGYIGDQSQRRPGRENIGFIRER